MKKVLLLSYVVVLFLYGNMVFAQPPEIAIEALSQRPEVYEDQEVMVRGKLIVIGDYWRDPKFVIVDERGNKFPVNSWLPFEIIAPPDGFRPGDEKRVMSYYLNKNLLIKGKVKAKQGKKITRIEGEHYLRVKEVKELDDPKKGGNAQ